MCGVAIKALLEMSIFQIWIPKDKLQKWKHSQDLIQALWLGLQASQVVFIIMPRALTFIQKDVFLFILEEERQRGTTLLYAVVVYYMHGRYPLGPSSSGSQDAHQQEAIIGNSQDSNQGIDYGIICFPNLILTATPGV